MKAIIDPFGHLYRRRMRLNCGSFAAFDPDQCIRQDEILKSASAETFRQPHRLQSRSVKLSRPQLGQKWNWILSGMELDTRLLSYAGTHIICTGVHQASFNRAPAVTRTLHRSSSRHELILHDTLAMRLGLCFASCAHVTELLSQVSILFFQQLALVHTWRTAQVAAAQLSTCK